MIINLNLAVSLIIVFFLIICFSGNLYINYNILSGKHFEPLYDQVINGGNYCLVTYSQFRVYNNVWYFRDIHWVLEETPFCKDISLVVGKGRYCLTPVTTSLSFYVNK